MKTATEVVVNLIFAKTRPNIESWSTSHLTIALANSAIHAMRYFLDRDAKHENRVRQLLKIARIPRIAKDIVKGNSEDVLKILRIDVEKSIPKHSEDITNYFKETHYEVFIMKKYMLYMLVFSMLKALLNIPLSGLADTDTWRKKADMPTAKASLSTSVVNGKIYAVGGGIFKIGTFLACQTVEEYDPRRDIWTKKASMLWARKTHSTSAVNGRIYAIGGIGSSGQILSAVEEYDPVTDEWETKAEMPTARGYVSTSVVKGKIYAIGGFEILAAGFRNLSTVEEYDPVADKWERKASMPTARADVSTSVVKGKIYAIGGFEFVGGGRSRPLSTVEEYNPQVNEWTAKVRMPDAKRSVSTSAVNGKIYVIGGEITEEYDPATETWNDKAPMSIPRWSLSTSVVDRKIYAIGGETVAGPWHLFSTVEEYTPEGWPFSVSRQGKLAATWGEMKQGW